jgi:folate-binding protein YgfZ
VDSGRPELLTGEPGAGDVFALQRAFLAGSAWLDASDRDLVTVTGPDRLTWLNSLVSQNLLDLTPGLTTESLILSPQGRIEHSFLVADDGATTWLLCEPRHRDGVAGWLRSMKFRMDVEVTSREHDLIVGVPATTGSLGTTKGALVRFDDPWPTVGEGSLGYATGDHPGDLWSMVYIVFEGSERHRWEGYPRISEQAWQGLAIAAARPSAWEVDEKSLPHELDWLRTAVHLQKGCYRGQEAVAKVHNLGHPPRRLTLLHLDGTPSTLPEPGDRISVGDKDIGHVTRAAWHWELGPIALGLVKRMASLEPASVLTSDGIGVAATQEVIVPPDAGAARPRQRLG